MLPGYDQPAKAPEKFFVVKSSTVQDLEASVRNCTWATQSHNETALSRAYEEADNVYLIFSANKSGEYFGYARMTSTISGEPVNLSSSFTQIGTQSRGVPKSIRTIATASAPKGRIIDDLARGTIFWEAQLSDEDEESSPVKDTGEASDGQSWGRKFSSFSRLLLLMLHPARDIPSRLSRVAFKFRLKSSVSSPPKSSLAMQLACSFMESMVIVSSSAVLLA